MQLTWTCACDSRPAAIRFLVAETPAERLEVRKTEKGERGLSIDYRIEENEAREGEICLIWIEENEAREGEICATHVDVRVRQPAGCDQVSGSRNACRNAWK